MTRFTDSPFEKMMTQKPTGRAEKPCPSSLPHDHPCYGCGNYDGSPCVGLCAKKMNTWLKERRKNRETGNC